jgi:trans-aconitate 2-methyltransferase
MPTWDPAQYARYQSYRERPALDLLARLPVELEPKRIVDLGCGPGEQAGWLARRWPEAEVEGVDSSPAMLEGARARPERVRWTQGDIASWAPETRPDLIFTNAALQWLPEHAALFPRLAGLLADGGVFACQVPMTFETAWHRQLRETAAEAPWAVRLAGVRGVRQVEAPETYHALLAPLCREVDIWWTTYLHVLTGEDPVVDWMLGTGLRPYLDALPDEDDRAAFLEAYGARVAADFPRQADGTTLFPFPRLFIVARR